MRTTTAILIAALAALCTACTKGEPANGTPGAPEDRIMAIAPPVPITGSAYEAAARIQLEPAAPEHGTGLHNVYRLSDRVISGSEPEGEAALAHLAEMGVKTIVSVDGKVPDAATAARHGMRYVHVPIHYSGISNDEIAQLVKTFRELESPFYVHCFHGKHRGPAGAALGRLVADGASREQALAEMRQWCGTSSKYEGLYQVIATAEIPDAAETEDYEYDFSPSAELGGIRELMVEVSRANEYLKELAARTWTPNPEHPDVDARNEAEKLAGLFERSKSIPEAAEWEEDFSGWIAESATEARRLHTLLKEQHEGREGAATDAQASYGKIKALCTSCHEVYRNR